MGLLMDWREAQDFNSQYPQWQKKLKDRLISDTEVQKAISEHQRVRDTLLGHPLMQPSNSPSTTTATTQLTMFNERT